MFNLINNLSHTQAGLIAPSGSQRNDENEQRERKKKNRRDLNGTQLIFCCCFAFGFFFFSFFRKRCDDKQTILSPLFWRCGKNHGEHSLLRARDRDRPLKIRIYVRFGRMCHSAEKIERKIETRKWCVCAWNRTDCQR